MKDNKKLGKEKTKKSGRRGGSDFKVQPLVYLRKSFKENPIFGELSVGRVNSEEQFTLAVRGRNVCFNPLFRVDPIT